MKRSSQKKKMNQLILHLDNSEEHLLNFFSQMMNSSCKECASARSARSAGDFTQAYSWSMEEHKDGKKKVAFILFSILIIHSSPSENKKYNIEIDSCHQ